MSEAVYSEKPPTPSSIVVSFISPVIGFLCIIWGLSLNNGIVIGVGVFTLFIGVIHAMPFFDRTILLTNKEIQVKLWWFEDKIPIEDVVSIERANKPEKTLVGWGVTPMGFGYRWLIFPLGVIKSKRTRWYVFGEGQTYVKINKRNGDAVCIGVENPEEFMNRWKILQSQQDYVDASQKVCACCDKPISFGEGWTEKENNPYHWECWRKGHDEIQVGTDG